MVNIIPSNSFKSAVKKLKKRYPNIITDIDDLVLKIIENYKHGTDLGDGFYKIRLKISDKKQVKAAVGVSLLIPLHQTTKTMI